MRKVFNEPPHRRKRLHGRLLRALTVSESRHYFADVLNEAGGSQQYVGNIGKAKALAYQMRWAHTDWSRYMSHIRHALDRQDGAKAARQVRKALKAAYAQKADMDTYITQLQRIESAL